MRPALDKIYLGDSLAIMRQWPDAFVNCVVTSPPYWGLRDYGVSGQIGLEKTPGQYVAKMVEIFREVRRVLRDDGTLWLNLGDSSAGSWGAQSRPNSDNGSLSNGQIRAHPKRTKTGSLDNTPGLKAKDLIGVPWSVAFALRADGWYLRSEIIWVKKNCMPESVTDRPTRSHETIFLMSKSPRYYYDAEAIKEPAIYAGITGMDENGYKDAAMFDVKHGRKDFPGSQGKLGAKRDKQRGHIRRHDGFNDRWDAMTREEQCSAMRNKRDVWTVAPCPFPEAHFATFPQKLIEPCILAGSPRGGVVLDPFMGAGTTLLVSARHDRRFLGCELNPDYIKIAEKRVASEVAQEKFL